jgi:predicted component of type VI protein secretion system
MPPQLVALTEGPDLLLDKPILLLGRHQECDIQLNSRKVSRRHCCIAQVSDHLVVRDLCSTNGIRINGVRVLEGNLKAGDQLTIGNYNYRVEWELTGEAGPAVSMPEGDPEEARAAPREVHESCEVPVPLVDHEGLDYPKARPQAPASGGKGPAGNSPHILPDDLGLAPLSDLLRRDSKPPSRSA